MFLSLCYAVLSSGSAALGPAPSVVTHYNEHRPHRALCLAPPEPRRSSVASVTDEIRVQRRDCLGGVIHEYFLAA